MKELSIKEKAERYDELLKKLQEAKEDNDVCDERFCCVIDDIVPELKESEDETIRNWLIGYFHQYKEDGVEKYANGLKVESIIAWLENQGEQKHQYKSRPRYVGEEELLGANKQGEQILANIAKTCKVEPKFKVGDWVVTDKCDTVQIGAVNNGYYTLYNGMIFNVSYVDKCWHLWTIADAKDGDVLKEGSCIFILRKMKSENTAITHCCLFDDGDFNLSPTLSLDVDSTFPATEEQRNLLFAKMKEEGYVWDAKKKEPKKIEQPKLTEFEDAIKDMMDDYRDAIDDNDATVEEVKERAAYLLSLIPQKPAAWSEEDKRNLNWVINVWNRLRRGGDAQTTPSQMEYLENFLKSLKDRYTWKPSDEQIGALEHFVRSIAESGFASPYDSNTKLVYSLFNDLKKLK